MSLLDRDTRRNVPSPAQNLDVSLGTIPYNNDRLPSTFNGNAEAAINYIMAHIFPKYVATVATPAALPGSANPNDYYIVTDDGDGKSAGYVWQVIDGAGAFYKRYDVDWSMEGIYAETINRTQYMYYHKYGMTDKDASGVAIVGLYAGQTLYGGDASGQNLTLNANSADSTGYVQTDSHFRPTADGTINLGTPTERFANGLFSNSIDVDTVTISAGFITDTSGTIDFDDENLITLGTLTVSSGFFTSQIEVGPLVGSALILAPGSITDESGAISFGNENLTTTGTINAAAGSVIGDFTIGTGSLTSASATISFGSNNLSTTGDLLVDDITADVIGAAQVNVDNLRLDGNTLSSTDVDGDIILLPNGNGVVDIQKTLLTLDIQTTGNVDIVGQLDVDNLTLNGNTISSSNLNGEITLSPNGSGTVTTTAKVVPNADGTLDLGATSFRFNDLYLAGSISDGTTSVTQATLQSLRDINVGVGAGFTLFWDGSKWVASAPDTEIDHGAISGLLDDDHTQYALLAGRAGGQSLIGGTAASNTLTLESTSHGTKGTVQTKDNFVPFTNASYSGGWQGTDLGDSSHFFRDIYTKGELKGARLENYTFAGLPANSVQNVGRVVYVSDEEKVYVDVGASWIAVGGTNKFVSDTVWDGVATSQSFDVSSEIEDARNALWQLCDNANDFERIYTTIKAISATHVQVVVSPALPAGSYRLLGIE